SMRPEIDAELDALVAKMMAVKPEDRYATPQALMRGLMPFLNLEAREQVIRTNGPVPSAQRAAPHAVVGTAQRSQRVLIVDDDPGIRTLCRQVLQVEGMACEEAVNGFLGVEAAHSQPCDLVLLDVHMPVLNVLEALRKLRQTPPCPYLKIVMI